MAINCSSCTSKIEDIDSATRCLVDESSTTYCYMAPQYQIIILCPSCNKKLNPPIKITYANDENATIKIYHVLDYGQIFLKDRMGTEERVVEAARISYGQYAYNDERDVRLLRYLMRHGHLSPFEHVQLSFFVRCPIYVWRQWIRHRTAHVNEFSLRYKKSRLLIESGVLKDRTDYQNCLSNAKDCYNDLLMNYPKETARIVLPLSLYTEAIWTIDLRNLLNFLEQRLDSHAQKEIRQYAEIIFEIISELFPNIAKAFSDYRLQGIKFSRREIEILRSCMSIDRAKLEEIIEGEDCDLSSSEKEEFRAKIEKIIFENKIS